MKMNPKEIYYRQKKEELLKAGEHEAPLLHSTNIKSLFDSQESRGQELRLKIWTEPQWACG